MLCVSLPGDGGRGTPNDAFGLQPVGYGRTLGLAGKLPEETCSSPDLPILRHSLSGGGRRRVQPGNLGRKAVAGGVIRKAGLFGFEQCHSDAGSIRLADCATVLQLADSAGKFLPSGAVFDKKLAFGSHKSL